MYQKKSLTAFDCLPIPICGNPRLRPSKSIHALHIELEDMYPQRVQVMEVGIFVSDLISNASPECMMSNRKVCYI